MTFSWDPSRIRIDYSAAQRRPRGNYPVQVFFTSDTHYGHANIIKHSKRPFRDVAEMDEAMIRNWNAVVRPGDLVYHLGDFAFCEANRATWIASRLAGQKYLVFGNHDKHLRKDKAFLAQWIWARDYAEIKVGDQKINLMHYAMLVWNGSHRGAWQLFGHSHGSIKDDPHALRLDVGVDVWNFEPVSFENLRVVMGRKTFAPVDHHGRRDE